MARTISDYERHKAMERTALRGKGKTSRFGGRQSANAGELTKSQLERILEEIHSKGSNISDYERSKARELSEQLKSFDPGPKKFGRPKEKYLKRNDGGIARKTRVF